MSATLCVLGSRDARHVAAMLRELGIARCLAP